MRLGLFFICIVSPWISAELDSNKNETNGSTTHIGRTRREDAPRQLTLAENPFEAVYPRTIENRNDDIAGINNIENTFKTNVQTVDQSITPEQTEGHELCENAEFLINILTVMLPLLRKDVPDNTRTSYILQILKGLLKSSPEAAQDYEVMFKIKDLLQTLEKYHVKGLNDNVNVLRSSNDAVSSPNGIKTKVVFKYEIPHFQNPNCTAELLMIIKVVQQAILRLVNNPLCKSKLISAHVPLISSIDTHLINPELYPYLPVPYPSKNLPSDVPSKSIYPYSGFIIHPYKNYPIPSDYNVIWPEKKHLIPKVPDSPKGYPILEMDIPDTNNVHPYNINPEKNPYFPYNDLPSSGKNLWYPNIPNTLEEYHIYPESRPSIPHDSSYSFDTAPSFSPLVNGNIDDIPGYPPLEIPETGSTLKPPIELLFPSDRPPYYDREPELKPIPSHTPIDFYLSPESSSPSPIDIKYPENIEYIPFIQSPKPSPEIYSPYQIPSKPHPVDITVYDNPIHESFELLKPPDYYSPFEVTGSEGSGYIPLDQPPKPFHQGSSPSNRPSHHHRPDISPNYPLPLDVYGSGGSSLVQIGEHMSDYYPPDYYLPGVTPSPFEVSGTEGSAYIPIDQKYPPKDEWETEYIPITDIYRPLPNPISPFDVTGGGSGEVKISPYLKPSGIEITGYQNTSPDQNFLISPSGNDSPNTKYYDIPPRRPLPFEVTGDGSGVVDINENRPYPAFEFEVPFTDRPYHTFELDLPSKRPKPYFDVDGSLDSSLFPFEVTGDGSGLVPIGPNPDVYFKRPPNRPTHAPNEYDSSGNSLPIINGRPDLPNIPNDHHRGPKDKQPYSPSLPSNYKPFEVIGGGSGEIQIGPLKPSIEESIDFYLPKWPKDKHNYPHNNYSPPYGPHPLINGSFIPLPEYLSPEEDLIDVEPHYPTPKQPYNDISIFPPLNDDPIYPNNPDIKKLYPPIPESERPDNIEDEFYLPSQDTIQQYPPRPDVDYYDIPVDSNFPNNEISSGIKKTKAYPYNDFPLYDDQYNLYPEKWIPMNPNLPNKNSPLPWHKPDKKYLLPEYPLQPDGTDIFLPPQEEDIIISKPIIMDRPDIQIENQYIIPGENNLPYEETLNPEDLVNPISDRPIQWENVNPNAIPDYIIPEQPYPVSPDKKILIIIKDNIDVIERKIPKISLNRFIRDHILKIKKLISLEEITVEQYVSLINSYEIVIQYIKNNTNKEILKEILSSMTNGGNLDIHIGKSNVIEFTYLIKRPEPLIYQPYYYIKYRLPYVSFVTQMEKLLAKAPYLSKYPAELYKAVIQISKVAETSPDLKGYGKEDILKITFSNGTLVGAKVVNGKNIDMYATLNKLKKVNTDLTLEDAYWLIKKLDMQLNNTAEADLVFDDNRNPAVNTVKGNDQDVHAITVKLIKKPTIAKKFYKITTKAVTSNKILEDVLNQVNNLRSNYSANQTGEKSKLSSEREQNQKISRVPTIERSQDTYQINHLNNLVKTIKQTNPSVKDESVEDTVKTHSQQRGNSKKMGKHEIAFDYVPMYSDTSEEDLKYPVKINNINVDGDKSNSEEMDDLDQLNPKLTHVTKEPSSNIGSILWEALNAHKNQVNSPKLQKLNYDSVSSKSVQNSQYIVDDSNTVNSNWKIPVEKQRDSYLGSKLLDATIKAHNYKQVNNPSASSQQYFGYEPLQSENSAYNGVNPNVVQSKLVQQSKSYLNGNPNPTSQQYLSYEPSKPDNSAYFGVNPNVVKSNLVQQSNTYVTENPNLSSQTPVEKQRDSYLGSKLLDATIKAHNYKQVNNPLASSQQYLSYEPLKSENSANIGVNPNVVQQSRSYVYENPNQSSQQYLNYEPMKLDNSAYFGVNPNAVQSKLVQQSNNNVNGNLINSHVVKQSKTYVIDKPANIANNANSDVMNSQTYASDNTKVNTNFVKQTQTDDIPNNLVKHFQTYSYDNPNNLAQNYQTSMDSPNNNNLVNNFQSYASGNLNYDNLAKNSGYFVQNQNGLQNNWLNPAYRYIINHRMPFIYQRHIPAVLPQMLLLQ